MAKIYVNLHPQYSYSNVIIGSGYIAFLKEYVQLVEWLTWDWISLRNKPIINVCGDSKEQSLELLFVLLQRILQDEKHEIFVRNERGENWEEYVPEKEYSEEEMQQIEFQPRKDFERKLKWCEENIEKFKRYEKLSNDNVLKEALMEELKRRDDLLQEEEDRLNRIRNLFC